MKALLKEYVWPLFWLLMAMLIFGACLGLLMVPSK